MYTSNETQDSDEKKKKQVFSRKKQFGLEFKKETREMVHLQRRIVWSRNLDTSESRSQFSGRSIVPIV
jgi:hypothetical protein